MKCECLRTHTYFAFSCKIVFWISCTATKRSSINHFIGIQLFENLNIMIENEVRSSCRQCVMHAKLLPDVYGLAHCSIRIRVCSNSAFLYYRKPNGKDDMCRKVVIYCAMNKREKACIILHNFT